VLVHTHFIYDPLQIGAIFNEQEKVLLGWHVEENLDDLYRSQTLREEIRNLKNSRERDID